MSARTDAESVQVVSERLRAFLAARNTGAEEVTIDGLQRSGTGSSRENWPFDASWNDAGTPVHRRLLLRRDPPSAVVDTGRSTEYALLKALEPTPVPAPVAYWLDDDGAELLRPSMVVDRHPGKAHRAVLRDKNPLGLSGQGRAQLAKSLCDLLARVHRVDVVATGLPAPLPDPATAEVNRWEGLLDEAELEPQPVLRWTLRWLRDHVPAPPDRLALVHGDFRPANVLVHNGAVEVLLDWELAHLGDPRDDLGWYCAPVYTREHFIPGVWEQDDFLRRYTELTGTEVSAGALLFWQVLSLFRLAVIALQGVRIFCAGETDRPAAPPTALLRLLAGIVSDHPGKA
ncbi:phosphotransferase family protein [Amycolatopsis sp. K13G38]|uniref:Phosphotransferase family protein n=1 Tax=Amycolatopsis acididurans TaxID=2724524 RepID=A0ABX1JEX8_9PSEU|nr:phosphotransferase family protein [Amycolatopsis acididurans]NKQ57061.1 phosphotransferase family protein [Amycolatopsis acididurans]